MDLRLAVLRCVHGNGQTVTREKCYIHGVQCENILDLHTIHTPQDYTYTYHTGLRMLEFKLHRVLIQFECVAGCFEIDASSTGEGAANG